MITHLLDRLSGKAPSGAKRSPKWAGVRRDYLSKNPTCALCGGKEKLEVHHVHPFHLRPDLELDETNLITLCEANRGGVNCHLAFGHLGNFKSLNESVREDAASWSVKIKNRPIPTADGGANGS